MWELLNATMITATTVEWRMVKAVNESAGTETKAIATTANQNSFGLKTNRFEEIFLGSLVVYSHI